MGRRVGVGKVKYARAERETVVLFNEAEQMAHVCTFNRAYIKKLTKLARRFPDKVKLTDSAADGRCLTFTLPKSCIAIYPPHKRTDGNTALPNS